MVVQTLCCWYAVESSQYNVYFGTYLEKSDTGNIAQHVCYFYQNEDISVFPQQASCWPLLQTSTNVSLETALNDMCKLFRS